MKKTILMLLATIPLLLCGCAGTFKEVKPLSLGPSPLNRPTTLVLGEIKVTDARLTADERQTMTYAFLAGVNKWNSENKPFKIAAGAEATNVPPDSIALTGEIKEVEKGSSATRFWVGMGAGQARIVGDFTITGADGRKLASFTARKSYLGGAGMGGGDMMNMEDLVGQLGQLVMETTAKWVQGEKIE